MLAPKGKALFMDVNEFSILVAVASSLNEPVTIEDIQECPIESDVEEIKNFVLGLTEVKSRGFLMGRCCVYPKTRFIRRGTLDSPAKAKDPGFFDEMLNSSLRIDPAKNYYDVLNAVDGARFDVEKNLQAQKELVYCGAEIEDFQAQQETLLEYGVYPDRLELGTLVSLGGLKNYAKFKDMKLPTLVLEITAESSNVFIFNQDRLDISRPIPYGLNSMFPVIQAELGLKDEESARKLFHSNTFDFTEMGPILLKKMLKELQASTGFYEVQTGQTIGQIFLTLLPRNLSWIHNTLSRSLAVDILTLDYPGWLKGLNISVGEKVRLEGLDSRWLGLFSMVGGL